MTKQDRKGSQATQRTRLNEREQAFFEFFLINYQGDIAECWRRFNSRALDERNAVEQVLMPMSDFSSDRIPFIKIC
ncbi:hypothetical protein FACS1894217_11930 [Clostridia bacterium]|nr:hypothetical protein FACS1894217_11930 [Clostridia bacterium]